MTDVEIVASEIREAEVPMTDALAAALERLERDAERYRWLRSKSGTMRVGNPGSTGYEHFQIHGEFNPMSGVLDGLIDEAMAAELAAGAA